MTIINDKDAPCFLFNDTEMDDLGPLLCSLAINFNQ